MTQKFTLSATKREHTPTATRLAEQIPAVVYGHGIDSQSIAVNTKDFTKLFGDAGSTSLVSLEVNGGKEHPVLIREVQFHPVRNEIMHVDFYQVNMKEKIRADVPIEFTNEAPAVRDQGGTLVRNMDAIDLSALPTDLPHNIEVDISELDDFEKVIRVVDLKLPEGVELHHEDDDVIALVQAPKTQDQIDAELAAEVTEDVDSVEGVADAEEAEEGEAGETSDEATESDSDGE